MTVQRRTLALAFALLAGSTTAAVAQEEKAAEPKQVDQRVADLSPLSLSLREVDINLRQSNDFSELFEIPGLDGLGSRYMRSSGALHAVFDQSSYDPYGNAEIPANTTFYIGAPPLITSANAPYAAPGNAIDNAIAPPLAYGAPTRGIAQTSVARSSAVRSMAAATLHQDGREVSSFTRSIRVDGTEGAPVSSSRIDPNDPLAYVIAGQPSYTAPPPRPAPDPDETPTYINDDDYRNSRVHTLIARAAQRENEKLNEPTAATQPQN